MAKFANKKILDGGNVRYTYLDGKKGKNNVTIYKNNKGKWAFKSNNAELTGKQIDSLKKDKILPKTVKAPVDSTGGDDLRSGNNNLAIPTEDFDESSLSAGLKKPVAPALAESDYSLSGSGGRPKVGIGSNKPTYAGPGTSVFKPGKGELSLEGASNQGNMPSKYSSGGDWSPGASSSSSAPFVQGEMPTDNTVVNAQTPFAGASEFADKGGTRGMSDPGFFQKGSAGNFQQFTGGQTDFSSLDAAMSPGLNTNGLDIGTGGEGSMWDSSFYRTKDGQLMKDSGVFGEDTLANQADITAGIKDQNDNSWGSADGWNAAGSVMKGVGGLASAYTGIKNYQLARDAHATQQNQWQQNYDQRLEAYKDNKDLANQEIKEKNRILKSRNSNRPDTDYYQSI